MSRDSGADVVSYMEWVKWWHDNHNEWNAMVQRIHPGGPNPERIIVVFGIEWWQRAMYA